MARIRIDKERCKGCELCVTVCPRKLIRKSEEFNNRGLNFVVFQDEGSQCTGCALCALICPDVAIEVEKD